jgi:FlaA1/EpsC-like NDP-sugar epimerase
MKKFILLAGDVAIFYASLTTTLFLRNGTWDLHSVPFLWLHAIWVLVFYSAGMYDWESFTPTRRFYVGKLTLNTMFANTAIAIGLFYAVPLFRITPKISLILDVAIVTMLLWGWRILFIRLLSQKSKIKVLFFGSSKETEKFAGYIAQAPSLGYKLEMIINHSVTGHESIKNIIRERNIDLIVV